jgi:hypothetical protein
MSISWIGTSDIWLWVFSILRKRVGKIESSPVIGPVVVVEARKVGIWMGVDWVGTSDVWLWVFLALLLGEGIEVESSPVVGPVVVVEAGEV